MPEFIGRPRMYEELSSAAQNLRAQNPYAQAISHVSDFVAHLIAKRGTENRAVAARKAQMEELRSYIAQNSQETKREGVVGSMMGKGYEPINLATTPASSYNAGDVTQLSDALRAMGIQPGQGDSEMGLKKPPAKPGKAGVVPLTKRLIDKVKPIVDLSEFEGNPVGLDTINHLLTQGRLFGAAGGKGKMTPEQTMRLNAVRLAAREHMQSMNDPMIMDKSTVPPLNDMADTYYNYMMNQQSAKGKPSLSDLFMRQLMPEMSATPAAAMSAPSEGDPSAEQDDLE